MSPLVLLFTLSFAQEPPGPAVDFYGYRVVNAYPHDINAFTQGLFFHDGHLYEGTGKHGMSRLSRRSLEDAGALQSAALNRRYFGEGIEVVGDRIYQLTWRSNVVFVYDRDSFERTGTLYNAAEGWGLAYDGAELILSDGTDTLRFVDPETFATVREIRVVLDGRPVSGLNEMEYIDGEVWANVWQTDFIVRIDPATGTVGAVVDLTGLSRMTELGGAEAVLNGIAWDRERRRLFVTGKYWAHLFEIEPVPRGE